MTLYVHSIPPLKERKREEGAVLGARHPVDFKVLELMLNRISRIKMDFSSSNIREVTINLPIRFEVGKIKNGSGGKKRSRIEKASQDRKAPLGLAAVDFEGWFNALMQFILYVPGLAEDFCFAPRSLSPIQEFLDQYQQDQQENRLISSTNGVALFRFLSLKFPDFHFIELFQYFLFLVHPKWEVQSHLSGASKGDDLFVTQSGLKKQFFSESGDFYDLDAFIERRPDGENVNYIAYVKVDGSWYQCDDERIVQLRSDRLIFALQRGALAHFKRIASGSYKRFSNTL